MPEYIEREALLKDIDEELECEVMIGTKEQNKYVNKGLRIARKDIKSFPAADVAELKPFVENAQFAIKATDSADNYSSGFRNGIRYCLALIEGKEPEYETLKGVKPIEKFPFDLCPSCNTVVSEHKKFCSECGQKLDWSEEG